ncbi:MAG: M15 family metallopeptidase [Candidatus Poribacteria bacterium]
METKGNHLTVLTESEISLEFGAFQYKESLFKKGVIFILPPWTQENMIDVFIPQIKGIDGSNGKFACHQKIAKPLQDVFAEIERQDLKDNLLSWGGCHVPRHRNWDPSRCLSAHSWGIAIDINVKWNAYGAQPAPKGKKGSVLELVPIFESFGFAWGGYFNTPDGMHFEYALRS